MLIRGRKVRVNLTFLTSSIKPPNQHSYPTEHSVMNMTFMRTDWQRSQLSIEPTRSQIGCVDRELSQLRGFAEIHIHRNNKALSAQIGARADRNRRPESIPN
jgi:hypothetical protein